MNRINWKNRDSLTPEECIAALGRFELCYSCREAAASADTYPYCPACWRAKRIDLGLGRRANV